MVESYQKYSLTFFFYKCLKFKFRRNKCSDYIYDLRNYLKPTKLFVRSFEIDTYRVTGTAYVYESVPAKYVLTTMPLILQQWKRRASVTRCSGFCRKLILLYQSTFAPYIHTYTRIYTHAVLIRYSLH